MLRIPLPFTDAVLLLTARWPEISGFARAGIILFCLLVPAILVVLYRYELQLVRRLTAIILLGLRLAVILFLLFVVFLQPIVARSRTEELQGRVLVAIDRSDSMKVADPQRPNVEKLRLARALKLAGELCPDARLDSWIRQYDDKKVLEWVGKDEEASNPARRQALAEERRRQHDEVCRRVDRLSRLGIVERVLASEGAGLLEALARKQRVELLGYNQEAWEVKAEQLSDLLRPFAEADLSKGPAKTTEPTDQGTDLRLPLVRALERSGKAEGKILGVVLLSDGQHNRHDGEAKTPVEQALAMEQQEMPIFPVVLGARRAPPDVAVARVRAPAAVFKDVDVPVEARIKVSGLGKQEIIVELQAPGQPPVVERIQHDGKDQYYTRHFPVRLTQVGTQTLTVTARPVAGEIRVDNNSRPIAINVADDKARVLLVDGEARWEFHYLANALLRDRTMAVQSIVFTQPRLGRVAEEDLEKIGNPKLQWPSDPDALAGYDCIVLGDVSPAQLPLAERLRLEKYVADRGGTLVLLAGKRYMPLAYTTPSPPKGGEGRGEGAIADSEETDPLLKLLPLLEPRAIRPVKGFPVTLTHQGQLASFLQMEPEPDKSLERWTNLPRHFWGIVGRAKPGATPLAYVVPDEAPGAPKGDDKDPGRVNALIVRQNYGFGRVLFVGLESTWRWRFKVGDTYHHRFWGQVIRWAAADKPLVAGNEHIRFGTREPVYRQGAEIDLVARLGENEKPLGAGALVGARIVRVAGPGKEDEPTALVPLARRPAQPRVLEGRLKDLPPGQYAIELAIPDLADKLNAPPDPEGKPGKLRASFTVLPHDSEEMIELAANWPLLEELAAKSGGKVFTPDNAAELIELLTSKTVTREHPVESKLWEEWVTLVLFLVLLTVEWVTRKLAGLP